MFYRERKGGFLCCCQSSTTMPRGAWLGMMIFFDFRYLIRASVVVLGSSMPGEECLKR